MRNNLYTSLLLFKKGFMKGLFLTLLISVNFSSLAQNLNNPNRPGPLGTYVNALTGNLFVPRTDIMIPARGFNIDIRFSYNSFLLYENYGYGNGWTFHYDIRYKSDTTPGRRIIMWGDGREDAYDSLPGGSYKTPRGFFSSLEQYSPGKFRLTETDSVVYFFDDPAHKRITRMQEPNGNYINFTYSGSVLSSLTNNAGQSISFTYDGAGRLASVVDAVASPTRTVTYKYDASNNLIEVKDPLGASYKYTYLVSGPMKSLADKNNNKIDIIYFPDFSTREIVGCNKRLSFSYDTTQKKTVVTDYLEGGTNQVTAYTYQKLENLSWITSISGNCCGFNMKYEYDDQGNKIKETDANGNVFTYTYDSNGNMLTATDPLGGKSVYTYSSDFNKITSFKDANGNIYTIEYDGKGNMVKLITPGNNVYAATYNSNGDIISSTDPKGNQFTYNYDAYGNPTNVTGPNGYNAILSFDARGNLLSHSDARGNTHTAEYDILNRLKKITDPFNHSLQYVYDAAGNIVSMKTKNNETVSVNYDASSRPVKITGPTGSTVEIGYDEMDKVVSVKDPLAYRTEFTYDTRSRLSSKKDVLGNTVNLNYDANGNVISASHPNGQTLNYTYDKLNRLTKVTDGTGEIASFSYDANGNVISYKNGTGAITTAQYDSLNRVKKLVDPLGNSTTYAYDKNNRIIAVTDRNGFTRQFTYDGLNRVKTATDNNGFVVTMTYDADGNLTGLTDQKGNVTTYTYDALNRRKTMTFPDGTFQEYTYDKKGNLMARKLTDGSTIAYAFDTLNRLTAKTLPGGEVYTYVYDKMGRVVLATNNAGTVTVSYDALGRVTSETYDGRTVNYQYNVAGRTQTTVYPDGSTVIKEFDTRNRLSRILKDSAVLVEYSYNNADQVTNKLFANGVRTTLQYDIANRLSSLTTASGTIQQLTYAYDKEGNKTAINRLNNPSLSETFSYDNGYRLLSYQRGGIQNTYTYDAVGNRIAANLNGTNNTYAVNNLNQLTARNGTAFTYDGRGNLVYDGQFYKSYDAEGRLIKDSSSPASVLTYAYDGMGRRVIKSINGNVFKYTYSRNKQIEERDAGNQLLNKTVFTNFLTPVMNEKAGNRFYYHQNELMSVDAITNAGGRLLESYRYDAFGDLQRFDSLNNPLSSSLAGNRVGFTGQEWDSATASYRFFYRNYSPQTGVFNQRDLIEYGDGMGMYQYVGNNPANGIDVWGLKCEEESFLTEKKLMELWEDIGRLQEILDFFGIELGDVWKTSLEVIGPYVDVYSTAKSLDAYSKAKTVSEKNMHAGDAVKNATNASIGFTAITAGLMGAGTVVSGAGAAAAGIYITDKGSEAYYEQTVTEVHDDGFERENQALEHQRERGKEYMIQWLLTQRRMEERQRIYLEWLEIYKKIRRDCPPPPPGGTHKPPPGPGGGGASGSTAWSQPIDPNDITGPDGVDEKKWVSVKDRMTYTIRCENDTAASAPARFIRITSPIHPNHDANTLELGAFGLNSQSFEIPQGTSSYYQRIDCRDSMGLFLDVVAGYDQTANQVFWELRGIDPITLLPTDDPEKGILFLRDTAKPLHGHGFFNFSIKSKPTAVTLDTTAASAAIVFDENEPIATNVWVNTIDAVAPTSTLVLLPASIGTVSIPLQYSATDDANGSGFKSADLFVSANNLPPVLWVSGFTGGDTTFVGLKGNSYTFYASAFDRVNNKEELKNLGSTTVRVGDCIGSHFVFTSNISGATYQWQVDDGNGFVNLTNNANYEGINNQTLVVKNTVGPMAGYRYRAVVNGNFSQVDTLKFVNYWQGTVSDAWEDPANWSCNTVPDEYTDVIIEGEKPRYPVVNSNPVIRTLKTETGASLIVRNGYNLTIRK